MENVNNATGAPGAEVVNFREKYAAIIVEKVAIAKTPGGKVVYTAKNLLGEEMVTEIAKTSQTSLERAYGAALGDIKWRGKGTLFFDQSRGKWVRALNVDEAIEKLNKKLAPQQAVSVGTKVEKPTIPTAEDLAGPLEEITALVEKIEEVIPEVVNEEAPLAPAAEEVLEPVVELPKGKKGK